MSQIDEHFKVSYNRAKSKEGAIFRGMHYRITILSEALIRFEYNLNGRFEDRPTEFALHRDFDVPEMGIAQDDRFLVITTKYFKLEYEKDKPFTGSKISPDSNLRVTLLNSDKVWYYNHKEVRNFLGTNVSLDDNVAKKTLKKGLYSTDGFATIDDSNTLVYDGDGSLKRANIKKTDFYLFIYRRDFGKCLKDYFLLTGKPPLIPRYSLGIWWNKNEVYNFESIKQLVTDFNRNNIPCSILLLGNSWHTNYPNHLGESLTGFTFNKELFPNPEELTKYLHERGIRIGLNINPVAGIMPHEEKYEEIASDLGMSTKSIIPFNIFDKYIVNTYLNRVIAPLTKTGIDFYWIDYYKNGNMPTLRALNYYHFNDYKKTKEKRGLILSRNGLVAAHRYPVHYSGQTIVSWDTLKYLPFFNSSASNIGISWWSNDIGGYKEGMEESELYMRYVQFGTYSPIFRFSSKAGHYYKREPWEWDLKTEKIVSDYCLLRHRLVPYLYTEAYKYYKTGLPLVQPLYYKYPEIYDEPLYKNEYYFGTELFVSPITQKKDIIMNRVVQRLFLPNGMWYDFKTGKKFPGGKRYITFFKDEDYPVFAKSGSIIPLANLEKNKNLITAPKDMEIHVFPGKSNTYNLYEDDGISSMYEDGYYIVTQLDYNYQANNYTMIIRPTEGKSGIIPDERNYKIRFRNTKEAEEVIVYLNEEKITCESYVEDNDFIVELKKIPTTEQLTINCKGKDIEIDAVRLINEDLDSIISDVAIETRLKEKIGAIIFSELDIKKKRIEIRKLKKQGLDSLFIRMFIKLLEYVAEI